MSIDYTRPAGTSLTIRPEPQAGQEVASGWRKPIQKATLGDDVFSRQVADSQGNGQAEAGSGEGVSFWGADGFGFDDVIDLINPLQHIPIISTIYRAITGDTIAAGPRLIGGGVIGGVIGAVASAADIMFEQETGKDIGENVMAMIEGDQTTVETPVEKRQVAKHAAAAKAQSDAAAVATLAPAPLSPEDFNQLQTAAQMSSVDANVIASADKHKSQTLLDLFGGTRTKAQQDYAKAQSLMYSQAVARDLKM